MAKYTSAITRVQAYKKKSRVIITITRVQWPTYKYKQNSPCYNYDYTSTITRVQVQAELPLL